MHPAVQHHVVNTFGWRSLRPHQEAAIGPVLGGAHVLVQAPTAGGKTESALLPLLSRMLSEGWGRPSVLYLCPIKALLNNLEARLAQLAGMVGRTVGVWHGDVGQGGRTRLLRERPDILLATPESVEVMLVSGLVDHRSFFASLRAVVVDEVHAFAGDDRGWHLLSLLERVSALAGGPVQRVALSATLANPDQLLTWLTAGREEPRAVVRGAAPPAADADVQVDWVGSLDNAALVLSRLHRGEKRLAFCDSRRQVEELAQALRGHGVRTFVSHSSLAADERRQAEQAFAGGSDCVIVATSTLELGLDVGDLDRVVQIDAPATVAGFLQRLGRTGRRAGARRNCLFLATSTDALLRACGLLRLWADGFVEPVEPPPLPYPVLAQQVLASVLQDDAAGVDRRALDARLARWRAAAGVGDAEYALLLEALLAADVLSADGPTLGIGRVGEARYGRRHFLELFSVFNTPPLVTVYHGLREVGQVHPLSFRRGGRPGREDGPTLLALGGRGWRVTHLDSARKRAWVEPAELPGRSRWVGAGAPVHFALAQAVARVLREGLPASLLSRRAAAALGHLREEFDWVRDGETTLAVDPARDQSRWWSFAGDRYNAAIAERLRGPTTRAASDGLGVTVFHGSAAAGPADVLRAAVVAAQGDVAAAGAGASTEDATAAMKFAECVPAALLDRLAHARFSPGAAAAQMAGRPVHVRVGL